MMEYNGPTPAAMVPNFVLVEFEYNGPTPPTMVPNCVTSHLKSFEYTGYQNSADEREFIAYVLQSGLVLKTATIRLESNLDRVTKDDILRKLSAIPRGSTTCQFNFFHKNPNFHGCQSSIQAR
ncbi:hypothetical protein PIB30_015661 [Stylosanthes scabra]|uniref:FBD domain-containing protein n=1 Tax=Stylosanthes scabra TaxID=79078 RepID=A0ABU6T6W5_9FABA|nr:hypothetical protein [Stylosanthes scabra]